MESHPQSPVAATAESFVSQFLILSQSKERRPLPPLEQFQGGRTAFPERDQRPVFRVVSLVALHKSRPWTVLGPTVLTSAACVHTPFLAVLGNKFHSKVSNHFTRRRDLPRACSFFYLLVNFLKNMICFPGKHMDSGESRDHQLPTGKPHL